MRIFRGFPHRYSWYIRRGYGIHAVRNKREAKALYDFCKDQIVEMEERGNYDNPRMKVYKMTMEMYQSNFHPRHKDPVEMVCCDCGTCEHFFAPYDIWDYVNTHAGWYWS